VSELEKIKISLVQMKVSDQKETNLQRAVELIHGARSEQPDMIVLPENFYLMASKEELLKQAETIDGKAMTTLREVARKLGVYLITGTIKMRFNDEEKLRNTCCVIDPDGNIQDMYHKIHVFNANVGGTRFRGSDVEQGGDEIVVTSIKGVRVGLSVCFDMRFPELFRILALKGAQVILVPSIFMLHTGKDHWETLLRARAIENQLYIAAPAVCGQFPPGGDWSYGRSMFVDPWGIVIGQASDFETTLTMELNLSWMEEVRQRVPSLTQRRPDVYQRYE
jgi:predicted amidohydrolase